MSRSTPSWPPVPGDLQLPAWWTLSQCLRFLEIYHEFEELIPSGIPDSEFPHPIASLDSSTTSHSSTDPVSVGFQGNGSVAVPNALNAYTSGTNMGMRGGHWDEEEHSNLLLGVYMVGWGKWKLIAEKYVPTRNEYQICSHAQKYRSHFYNGLSTSGKMLRKKRQSIHDVTLKDEYGKALPLAVPPCYKGNGPAMRPPPPPLPEDSRGWMPLLLDLPPPPSGRGGDTDPASILHGLMSDSFDIGTLPVDHLDEILNQQLSSFPF